MKRLRAVFVPLIVSLLAGCGGGGSGNPSPVSASPSWQQVGTLTSAYNGTVLGTATLRRPDGTNVIVFSGPTVSLSPVFTFTCDAVPYRAINVGATGSLTDATASLNANHTVIVSRAMVVADINNDGIDDVFSANSGCDNWQALNRPVGEANGVFLSSGNGFVDDGNAITDALVYTHSATAAVTGYSTNVDVLVGAMSYPGPYILRGNGSGGFTKDTTSLDTNIPLFTASKFVDVNGDGKVDLVIGTQQDSSVAGFVYPNDGHGKFTGPAIPLPTGINGAKNNLVMDIVPTDLNGDGKPDLLLSTTENAPLFYGNGKIQVLIGNGDGTFSDQTSTYFAADNNNTGWIQFLHLIDLDGDGKLDVLLQMDNPRPTDVIAYRKSGSGYIAIPRDQLPANVTTLVPAVVNGNNTLVSLISNGTTVTATAYQRK